MIVGVLVYAAVCSVAMLWPREAAVFHSLYVGFKCCCHRGLTSHEIAYKTGFSAWGDVEHIVQDKDLTRARLGCPNANAGNGKLIGQLRCQRFGYGFHD